MTITYEPKKVVVFLGTIAICLILVNIVGVILKYYFGYGYLSGFIPLFNLDTEQNIPTLFSSVTILLCSGLLSIIAIVRKKQEKRDYLYWAGLAVVFLLLSFDEFIGIHERLIKPIRTTLHTSGLLFFAWVIPYGIFVVMMMLVYLRFLISLAVRIRYLIILAGILYLAGALGGEFISGYWYQLHGRQQDIIYALMTTGEESLEMAGVLVFIYALMSYIDFELNDLFFRIGSLDPISVQSLPRFRTDTAGMKDVGTLAKSGKTS